MVLEVERASEKLRNVFLWKGFFKSFMWILSKFWPGFIIEWKHLLCTYTVKLKIENRVPTQIKLKPNYSCTQKLKVWASRWVVHSWTGPAYKLPENRQQKWLQYFNSIELIWLFSRSNGDRGEETSALQRWHGGHRAGGRLHLWSWNCHLPGKVARTQLWHYVLR